MVSDYTFETMNHKKKIIMVPYPAQGHVTPMLKLASSLSTFGFQPLIILPEFIHRSIFAKVDAATKDEIVCMSIPDGLDETKPRDFFAIEMAMENNMPAHLDRLVRKLNGDDVGVACMIVDLVASWAIDVGKECGVKVAGFWPAMEATYSLIRSIPDMICSGLISKSGYPRIQGRVSIPNQPTMNIENLPWLIGTQAAKKARFKFWVRAMERSKYLDYVLVNTFPNESQSNFNSDMWIPNPICGPINYPIGPLKGNKFCESLTFWEEDTSCLEWLDKQKPNSVVYVSFGSWVSPIGEANVRSLALSLEEVKAPFIWVLGPTWRDGLPYDYIARNRKYGKIVSWAPQIKVLEHNAVGCYLTHCGWNSTMEAIQCKKCMICYPIAGDQFLNCEFIVNVWKIGVKMNGFSFKYVKEGIIHAMEDSLIKRRIEELNERITGQAAISITKKHMLSFVNDTRRDLLK